ncbi:hypothetical protein [Breznakiella homolactica]|uniref:Uncharacterized protein n=1 Tax=Breznakiella homolactica TaxID=2798577 RepID=A0A7T7XLR9_9SPIR|nr:hypothetical protein [Breznakiella homolactica]QQO08744.1 hypothetical protein JFL75_17725 [Breznakiella homolactica]
MKTKGKIFLLVLSLSVMIFLIACDNGTTDDPELYISSGAISGTEIILSQQQIYDFLGRETRSGTIAVKSGHPTSSVIPTSGSITTGLFTVTIDSADINDSHLFSPSLFGSGGLSVSDPNAKIAVLDFIPTFNDSGTYSIVEIQSNNDDRFYKYVYADRAVTINGETAYYDEEDREIALWKVSLVQGWNWMAFDDDRFVSSKPADITWIREGVDYDFFD